MSFTILTKDKLRERVESLSDNRVTVLYDAYGFPSFMRVIPKFNLSKVNSAWPATTHPAFTVAGIEKDYIYVGLYQASIMGDVAVSIPGVIPKSTENTVSNMRLTCSNKGTGWHPMTLWEYSAVVMQSMLIGQHDRGDVYQFFGNSDNKSSYHMPRLSGTLSSDWVSGDPYIIYNGSGPIFFRHDRTSFGIHGLIGNYSHFLDGSKYYNDDEFYIQEDNNFSDNINDTAYGSEPTSWIKLEDAGSSNVNITSVGYQDYAGVTWSAAPNNVADADILKYALLEPSGGDFELYIRGQINGDTSVGEGYIRRGGTFTEQGAAGPANATWALTRTSGLCQYRVVYIP